MNVLQQRFTDRLIFLEKHLNGLSSEIAQEMPVSVSEILDVFNNINEEQYINKLVRQFSVEKYFDDKGKGFDSTINWDNKGLAAYFGYFYDGGDAPFEAFGQLYEKCGKALKYSNTDLVRLEGCIGVESDVVFSSQSIDIESIDIAPCLVPCHEVMLSFIDLDDDIDSEGVDITYIIQALFQTKMYLLMNKAYQRVQSKKSQYVFICTHGRWPVLIGSNI